MWWQALLGVVVALGVLWVLLLAALWRSRPDDTSARAVLRLLPDVLRLVARLARDGSLPTGVRLRLWLLLGYLALPFDVVPDVIPVIGYADDVVLVLVVLRSVVRRAGEPALRGHWPGTEEGFEMIARLAGLRPAQT
jgi:uncharacterized membrane protein YkvA (DUF1232 family)